MPRGLRERYAQIVEHGGEVAGQGGATADQYIITVRSHWYAVQPLHQFAKPAPDAIALGGVAVLFGNGEADPDRAAVVAATALQDERGTIHPRAIGNGEEIRSLPQPIHNEIPKRGSGSGAQTLAAARTAGSENLAAAGGGQARAKTVTALAHELAGLIGPLHGSISADIAIRPWGQSAVELRRRPVMLAGQSGRLRPQ